MSRSVAPAAPIGLAYVASATADAGHDVAVVDLLFSRNPARLLKRAVSSHVPDIIGISVRNIDNVIAQRHQDLLGAVRPMLDVIRAGTSAPVVLGGPAISILGTRALELLDADFAVIGEGEQSLPRLIDSLFSAGRIEDVPGLCRKSGPGVACNSPARHEAFGGSGLERWIDWGPYDRAGATWPIQTRRGCTLGCSYCTYPSIEGTTSRSRDAADVVDEIELVADRVEPRTFEFVDSTFTVPASHAVSICEEILRRKLRVRLSTMGGNPLGIDVQLLSLMKRAGFNSIMVTPESASEKMLIRYRKGFSVRHVEETAEAVHASGLPSAWFFMLGGPGETRQTIEETLSFIERRLASPTCLVVVAVGVRVFPGSGLEREVGSHEGASVTPYYLSPEVDEAWILERINRTITRCHNVVHACEDGASILQRVAERALCTLGKSPPYWRHMPALLGLPPIPWLRSRYPATGTAVERGA